MVIAKSMIFTAVQNVSVPASHLVQKTARDSVDVNIVTMHIRIF